MGLWNNFKKLITRKPEGQKGKNSSQPKQKEGFFSKLKNSIIPRKSKKSEGKKEKIVKKTLQGRTKFRKEKKEGFLKRLFKSKKQKEPTKEPTKIQTKKIKSSTNLGLNPYSIQNKAKKADFELISDMSVLVKLKTNKGYEYRYWGIFSKDGKKISNIDIYNQISDDIYINNNIHTVFTTSGQEFNIESFEIIASYVNDNERW
jgi:hypothetical protein